MDDQGLWSRQDAEGPLYWPQRIATRLHSMWLKETYPFAAFGRGTSIDYSCDVQRSVARFISIGDDVYVAPGIWLNVTGPTGPDPKIIIGSGCKLGRRSMISSRNKIVLQADVLFSPGVLVMDHNHEFSNINLPIYAQGITDGGRVTIERNCWLGYGAVVVCNRGELTIGRNSVIGANAVVTKSFPAFSVIAGNPAKLVKQFDEQSQRWVRFD